ncbi:Ser-Thr-rich glycosyl-phosphatidyl-inositol-anchored membrane family-domain-containing protein [Aspergillus leporis]|uniref:Ser-Thr-rich glycosyl-phosphatidyl-inositol-anchored membrane family-domain-containing protein n=1 Tax=Aspergillus leporis TaxID=41062 RepID=A0A5N5WRK4_9EURO|nr:Ser-Thr-rich glycosyl-phosphatidyl-inositol-anchored membrane family-domain-containing protein [Aspergillus leporis]
MRLSYAVSLLPLAASVGALQVTSPKKGDDVDLSDSFTVKWDSVDTDPSSFDLYIVNNAVYPNVEQKIASDVDTTKGSYSVSGLSGLTDGKGYQINFLSNSAKNSGILAQSQQFNGEGASESSSSASATETKTTASSTGTSTASTVSSSARASSTAHASGNGTSAAVPTSTGAGVALAAPVSAAAGLLMGVLALNL